MIIWSSTFRALSIDDFRDAVEGRAGANSSKGVGGGEDLLMNKENWKNRLGRSAGKNDELSMPAFIQMVKMMGGGGSGGGGSVKK